MEVQEKKAPQVARSTLLGHKLVGRLAEKYGVSPDKLLDTLVGTTFRVKQGEQAFSEAEIAASLVICEQYGLNPFTREVYVTRNHGLLLVMVSVDGWIKVILRQEDYDGCDFEWVFQEENKKLPYSCTCTMHVAGRAHPEVATEYYHECFRPTEPWKTAPCRMLKHRARIQAARGAFGLTEITDADEMEAVLVKEANAEDAARYIAPPNLTERVQPVPAAPEPEPVRRRQSVGAKPVEVAPEPVAAVAERQPGADDDEDAFK